MTERLKPPNHSCGSAAFLTVLHATLHVPTCYTRFHGYSHFFLNQQRA